MKKWLLLALVALLSVSGYAQALRAEKVVLPNCDLRNFYRIDSAVYRSDQPSRRDFRALDKFGICEVLNLRNYHSDDREAEGTSIELIRLRTNAYSISIEALTVAMRIIRDRRGPILIHCLHGSDRTGAVVAMYRMVFQGVPRERAIRELTDGGFGYHRIFFNIVNTLEKADIPAIRRKLGLPDPLSVPGVPPGR